MWRQRNNRPHDVWATQGVGIGPSSGGADGRGPEVRQVLDGPAGGYRVTHCGGLGGDEWRDVPTHGRSDHPGKGLRAPFEAAYQNLKEVMGRLASSSLMRISIMRSP